jgi:hypothetical protein
LNPNFVKLISWYGTYRTMFIFFFQNMWNQLFENTRAYTTIFTISDNEYGYSSRVVDLLAFAAKKDGAL